MFVTRGLGLRDVDKLLLAAWFLLFGTINQHLLSTPLLPSLLPTPLPSPGRGLADSPAAKDVNTACKRPQALPVVPLPMLIHNLGTALMGKRSEEEKRGSGMLWLFGSASVSPVAQHRRTRPL
jgi:hypothetical protein